MLTCSERGGDATECRYTLDTLLACLHAKSAHELACETWIYDGNPPCPAEEQYYELCAAPFAENASYNWR